MTRPGRELDEFSGEKKKPRGPTAHSAAHSPLPGEELTSSAMSEQERNALRVWTVLAIGLIAIALSVLYALA